MGANGNCVTGQQTISSKVVSKSTILDLSSAHEPRAGRRNRIIPRSAEGVAPPDPAGGKPTAGQRAEAIDRLERVR
jgi:hypothetical protein